jgi:hypothetical protein
MRNYFYNLLFKYISLYIRPEDLVVCVNPFDNVLFEKFKLKKIAYMSAEENLQSNKNILSNDGIAAVKPDYILLDGALHYENDIYTLLTIIRKVSSKNTRLVLTYYSSFWRPLIKLATFLGIRSRQPESNWISPEDVSNFLLLSGFEEILTESRVLFPIYVPVLSNIINRYISPLPVFNLFNLVNITIARPLKTKAEYNPSVSVVIAARNEEGNIDDIIKRIPKMGPDDEIIFVEGRSTDNTWGKIKELANSNKEGRNIIAAQQNGQGKGDAVRKGFSLATKDILMILDADLTVPPEDLPKFYEAIVSGKGEYINGSRLVYPMEKRAMRFLNIIGNKFFAVAFSFLLGQRFKDTLCGTKVISRENYLKLAKHRSYFGEFDPFGDFDLIFGSARLALKIVEVPIKYRERVYGDTNISRWRHGLLLLRMLVFAARRIKFI